MTAAAITRTVEWQDTDAAGHYHHSSVIRWVEAAESELYRTLDAVSLMDAVPRVRYEVDYTDRLYYGDEVAISLRVASVGTTSLAYAFEVIGPRGPAAHGRMVVVHVDRATGSPTPWPQTISGRLSP